ncbi:MAG TPA: DUF1906 domain-containing protein [Polyangiaceae bacterium]
MQKQSRAGGAVAKARWWVAFTGLAVSASACGGSSGAGESLAEQSEAVNTQNGVDYSWYRPSPSTLKADGYVFACRYLSHDTTGKNLSKSEADALIAAGVGVVDNWEDSATDALSGYNLGVSDAQTAQSQASADGAPSTRPIYFSVDFDATSGDMAAITAYFEGVASVIGVGRTGAYGGYYVVSQLFDAGKIKWGWQTYAWSGGQWDSRAQLRQVQNGIAGGQMDLDQTVAADFGQWGADLPPVPDQPKGYLDTATCTTVTGWSQDPAVPTTSINTDVYYDGAAGASGATGIRLTADVNRPDLCSAIGSCDHGFSMPTPRSLMDGKAHPVYAYGINHTAGGINSLLTNSPKSLTCTAPAIAKNTVKRHVTSTTILTDWRFDTFTDEAPYTTAEIAAVADGEDLASAPDVVQVAGNPAIYVVDGKAKRHVTDPASFDSWRLTTADVKPITAAALAALETGPDWPATPLLAKDPTAPAVYMLDVPPDATGVGGTDGGVAGSGTTGPGSENDAGSAGNGGSNGAQGDGQASAGGGGGGGCAVATGTREAPSPWLLALMSLAVASARLTSRRTRATDRSPRPTARR